MLLSVVIPVFNEAQGIGGLLARLCPIMEQIRCEYEMIFVNDGSSDGSLDALCRAAEYNPSIKVLSFSRNFGHQIAITAGLDFASGDAVIVMDSDLQDPPELLPRMVALYREGYDIVSPQRISRRSDSLFKRSTAALFYWIMRRMVDPRVPPEVGDFRLYSAAALAAIRQFREQHRFMRGLVAWLGLNEAVIPFERQPRFAGDTKYPVAKMVRLAWTAVTSFSGLPLQLCTVVGVSLMAFSVLAALWVAYGTLFRQHTTPGWASLVILQCVLSGSTLFAVGLLGDYVARLYDEAKSRPLYVVSDTMNVSDRTVSPRAFVLPSRSPHSGPEDEGVADAQAVHVRREHRR